MLASNPRAPARFGSVVRRRSALAALVAGALAIACPAAAPESAAAGAERPPNIVLVFADDLGWGDVGYNGDPYFETPNIDRLAAAGMVFTAGYASAGNCQPSRACLVSGQYTPRHHVYAVGSTDRGSKNLMRLVPIPNRSGIPAAEISIADALRSQGYATGIFGKWHLGGKEGCEPGEQGFDVVMDNRGQGRGSATDPKGIYAITRAACHFIEANRDRPFFAYVSHHAIHTAWQARAETLERFKNKERTDEPASALYAACLADLDDGVGILLEKLSDLGLDKNTLVIFTSDNGRIANLPQEPLRGGKGSYYEGGIRVPFVARWPGVVEPGSRCDVPVINIDLFPTFLAVAGGSAPDSKILDGENLLPLLKGAGGLERSSIFWHFPGYLNGPVHRGRDPVFRTRPVSAVRKGDWKLLLYHEQWQLDGGRARVDTNNAIELYNLADDPGERHNLAGSHADRRDELLDEMLAWHASTGALLPTEENAGYRGADRSPPPAR